MIDIEYVEELELIIKKLATGEILEPEEIELVEQIKEEE